MIVVVPGFEPGVKHTIFFVKAIKTVAVSSEGMQDHFGAKSANWLAG